MEGNRILTTFEGKRLSRLLRQAALAHIRREYRRATELIDEALVLLEWSDRPDWKQGLSFFSQWREAVRDEQAGRPLRAAPAAWIHLSQELAHRLETGDDWVSYLHTRWSVAPARLPRSRRLFYGALSSTSLGLSAVILALMVRALFSGRYEALLESPFEHYRQSLLALLMVFARVAGTVLMLEQGLIWAKQAWTGETDGEEIRFLSGEAGLALVDEPPSL